MALYVLFKIKTLFCFFTLFVFYQSEIRSFCLTLYIYIYIYIYIYTHTLFMTLFIYNFVYSFYDFFDTTFNVIFMTRLLRRDFLWHDLLWRDFLWVETFMTIPKTMFWNRVDRFEMTLKHLNKQETSWLKVKNTPTGSHRRSKTHPTKECTKYDIKPFHGETSVYELWWMWSTSSLPLNLDSLWPGMVVLVRFPSVEQLETLNHFLNLKPFNCVQPINNNTWDQLTMFKQMIAVK